MGRFRRVLAESMMIDAMSVAIDDNRAALRFLVKVSETELSPSVSEGDVGELIRTQKLAAPYVAIPQAQRFYRDGETNYVVFSEAILDKRLSPFQAMWTPGVHFVFHYNPARGLQIDPKGALSFFTHRNTAELIAHMGGLWYFDIWVRNPQDKLIDCARSITTAPGTKLFTNLNECDLGEPWDAREVMKGGRSKWLNLDYRLTSVSETVAPGQNAEFVFEVLDGLTHERATDVSWDGYRIEAVDGYAPHRRFSVVNGIGRFRVTALGLESGETMRVKVANRFQSSIAECEIAVS